MSFQEVRAVFEVPVMDALAALPTPVPCYVDNQAFTVPDAGQEYATINLQFGQTTSKVLTGNLERLRGSLVIECFTAKNTGPARARLSVAVTARYEEGTTVRRVTTRTLQLTNPTRETSLQTSGVQLVTPVAGLKTQEDANKHFAERIESLEAGGGSDGPDPAVLDRLDKLESTHDDHQGHDSGNY